MSGTVVVINRHSSGSRAAIERLPALFAAAGIDVDDFVVANDHKRLCRRSGKAVKAGASRLIVGGGDGTMAAAMQYLARAETTLGLLPLGTGNSFAKTMMIPHDVEAAVRIIAAGRVAHVDLGRVNDTYFANFASIGLAAEIARETPNALKALLGPLAYAVAGLRPLVRHRAFRARLRWGEHHFETRTQQIVVASGRYFGHQPLTPEASVTDGKLSVFLDQGTTPFDVARTYAAMAVGQHTRLPDAFAIDTAELVIKTRPRQPISVDGDDGGRTPARFRVEPGALRVFVSEAFPTGSP